jgi:hypothetical protein
MTYSIVRFYQLRPIGEHTETIKEGLTLSEAQAHCHDPETSSRTATSEEAIDHTREHGPWFDGFTSGLRRPRWLAAAAE